MCLSQALVIHNRTVTVRAIYKNRGRYQSKMISLLQECWCKMKKIWKYVRLNGYQRKDSLKLWPTISWSISNFLSCLLPDRYIIYHNTCINNNISVVLFTFKPFFQIYQKKYLPRFPILSAFPLFRLCFCVDVAKNDNSWQGSVNLPKWTPKAMNYVLIRVAARLGTNSCLNRLLPKRVGA